MDYVTLKWLHILSAFLLFGTGLGSAYYKLFTDRSGDVAAIAVTNRLVVRADWIITATTIVIQPLTGLWMLHITQQPLTTNWVWISIILYLLAGACWLPVVGLQIRMARIAAESQRRQSPLPAAYARMARTWLILGIPAFAAMVAITGLMVHKPA